MWKTVAERPINASSDDSTTSSIGFREFRIILDKWFIECATIVSPPLESVIELPVVQQSSDNNEEHILEHYGYKNGDSSYELIYQRRRECIPKRKLENVKKNSLVQSFYMVKLAGDEYHGVYVAEEVEDEDELPAYHPKTKAFRYVLSPLSNRLRVDLLTTTTTDNNSPIDSNWTLCFTRLLKKLFNWCKKELDGGYEKRNHFDQIIAKEPFEKMYLRLKEKHAAYWLANWDCESTNPRKMIFEELAIAAFLICLWEEQRKEGGDDRKVKFVDLGCGNGFLCHVLLSEGYSGYGIDVWSRKIWDRYPASTRQHLHVETISNPNEYELATGTNWIIGNHADELVLWVPIMAHRQTQRLYSTSSTVSLSSSICKFMVLPCCFFDLNGRRMKRLNCKSQTQYQEFLANVEQTIGDCNYVVERETLRIPSTKNIAFVGRQLGDGGELVDVKIRERLQACGPFEPRLSDREITFQRLSKERLKKAKREEATINEE